ncbi:MAG TPA: hypothetical protein VFS15_10715 [Kofleriaceae bacterium]|nr:hypothetical protein [Kofleriaceae bacterium]
MDHDVLLLINIILAFLGGMLAAAALIISKKPDAKQYIDKLAAYQAIIGVGLVAVSVINFLRVLGYLGALFHVMFLFALAFLAMVVTGFLLGALFGMPQIAKWIPGDSPAEQKAVELSKKVTPYQVTLGVIAVIASLIVLLYWLHIL